MNKTLLIIALLVVSSFAFKSSLRQKLILRQSTKLISRLSYVLQEEQEEGMEEFCDLLHQHGPGGIAKLLCQVYAGDDHVFSKDEWKEAFGEDEEVWNSFDVDQNGEVDQKELKDVLTEVKKQYCKEK